MSDEAPVINVSIQDKTVLYAAYMPFIIGGGIFIPTRVKFKLGDMVQVTLKLLDEPEPHLFSGKVIWLTPEGAEGNRQAGIGVQLPNEQEQLRLRIETYLAGSLKSDASTHTL